MKAGKGWAKTITSENLEEIRALLGHGLNHESDPDSANRENDEGAEGSPGGSTTEAEELKKAAQLFSGTSLPNYKTSPVKDLTQAPPKARASRTPTTPGGGPPSSPSVPMGTSAPGHRRLVWRKEALPASDVQRQPGNPTGGLRFTQAKWPPSVPQSQKIDQTTYFRHTVFGSEHWRPYGKYRAQLLPGESVFEEEADLDFDITIDGKAYDTRTFAVSHKPSGEAAQGNYTTILKWGAFGSTIWSLNLVGKTLSLYAPAAGIGGPYLIEIS